jgi:transcriptional antiterminator RfaH
VNEGSTTARHSHWFVVQTHSHREALAIENLQQQRYVVYCPLIRRRVRHARRAYDAKRPLFPGYVFVADTSAAHHWRPILSTLGVRSLIRVGDRPASLDGEFVAALRSREVDGVIGLPDRNLKPGQRVAVQGGPMDGVVGTILETRENRRHLILLHLLNASIKANVEQRNLRLVG